MADVHLGVLKPEYVARAGNLRASRQINTIQSGKALKNQKLFRNSGHRVREHFLDQAHSHMSQAMSDVHESATMTPSYAGKISRRASFDDQRATWN